MKLSNIFTGSKRKVHRQFDRQVRSDIRKRAKRIRHTYGAKYGKRQRNFMALMYIARTYWI